MITKMEVRITSIETVRPYSPDQVDALKPFKLSFLDQLIPPQYAPLIFFYPKASASAQISFQLKESLSKALNVFYPVSGRVVNNFCIDYYKEGVPYIGARVNGCVLDYLQTMELDEMNGLLPCESFRYHSNPTSLPLFAVQVNVFDCGGIALALCGSHKIFDGATGTSFFRSWAAFCRGENGEIPQPELLGASSTLLPPMDRVPPKTLSTLNSFCFKQGRFKTKRFAFDANAVAALISKAKSKSLERPSKTEALAAFIWKHTMLASRSATGIIKPSVLTQAVDMRRKMNPRLPDYAIGNLSRSIAATYESAEKDIELHDLALRMRRSLKNFSIETPKDGESLKVMINEQVNHQFAEFVLEGNVDLYVFSSWFKFGMHQLDFGWGKPSWLGLPGVVAPTFNNFICLSDIGEDNAVEAWVTLDEKHIAILEQDSEFLAFASPNPHYLKD